MGRMHAAEAYLPAMAASGGSRQLAQRQILTISQSLEANIAVGQYQ
jgi:hypothetical protein